jgi:tRNA 2-selenouridine synthase
MIREITVEELEKLENPVLVDVRSEGEFEEASIPGAKNLPLFNNEERAKVGTTYTQISPTLAREQGLEIVGPKLPNLVKQATEWGKGHPLVLFCWRGGMRSKSLSTVLDLMGISVYRLQGGYKAYRHMVNDYFERNLPCQVVVLRGNTGVGKTDLLKQLREDGYPAIDLERLANNRGSVFGALGLGPAPSQKKFEASLYEELNRLKDFPYVVVECESKRIGRVTLPVKFFDAMQSGVQVLIHDSLENRVKRLVKEYTTVPNAIPEIKASLERLIKNLGHKKVEEYNALLDQGDINTFTEEMLKYYDALYAYPNEASDDYEYSLSNQDPEKGARELEDYLDQRMAGFGTSSLSGICDTAK